MREASAVCGHFRFAALASALSLACPLRLLFKKSVFLSLNGGLGQSLGLCSFILNCKILCYSSYLYLGNVKNKRGRKGDSCL